MTSIDDLLLFTDVVRNDICLSPLSPKVVGNERQPSLADKANLNYLQAFVLEILRHGSVGEFNDLF